ncbi:hypothetical protein DPMN_129348 [Dreissena polymorpha]|uniref:Uncharacterized protein n=1 Tax=Dreissena polymorpha TaxID=45954 RepID=A0A9D4H5K6_DREPO|nr:hypothetical protein DPMN_129348 [Dreissena polymorpha]
MPLVVPIIWLQYLDAIRGHITQDTGVRSQVYLTTAPHLHMKHKSNKYVRRYPNVRSPVRLSEDKRDVRCEILGEQPH